MNIKRRILSSFPSRPLLGSRSVSWSDVWEENYCVKVKRTGARRLSSFLVACIVGSGN